MCITLCYVCIVLHVRYSPEDYNYTGINKHSTGPHRDPTGPGLTGPVILGFVHFVHVLLSSPPLCHRTNYNTIRYGKLIGSPWTSIFFVRGPYLKTVEKPYCRGFECVRMAPLGVWWVPMGHGGMFMDTLNNTVAIISDTFWSTHSRY